MVAKLRDKLVEIKIEEALSNRWIPVEHKAKKERVTIPTVLNRIRNGSYSARTLFGKLIVVKDTGEDHGKRNSVGQLSGTDSRSCKSSFSEDSKTKPVRTRRSRTRGVRSLSMGKEEI